MGATDEAPSSTASPHLVVPPGFVIEQAAVPPLVERPITAAFDEVGRLYVAESSGSNDPVEQQLRERPHRIVRLEDADGDGRFDRRVVFADRMMFPEGTMYFDGSLYVSAPPSIWKLTDVDG
ncbi:MAG: dehydrogenase, partial [Planctomycetota bacterium]